MYYVNGRYYDPQMGHFVDADTPENLWSSAYVLNALDRNAITCDNLRFLLDAQGMAMKIFIKTRNSVFPLFLAVMAMHNQK